MTNKFNPRRAINNLFTPLALAASLSACAAVNTTPSQPVTAAAAETTAVQTYAFKKGQLLSFVSVVPKNTPEAKTASQEYFARAFPLASKHGFKREGQLLVKAVPVGNHKSEGVILYSWPDQASEDRLTAEADWADIKTLRPQAWEELRIYTTTLQDDLTLSFDPAKTYTLAMAWNNPKNPDHYDLYMDGIRDAVTEVGGRFVHKIFDPAFESNTIKDGGPGQVTLVEWDSPKGLQNFGKTEGFKQNAHYLKTGVTRFEILVLGTS